VTPDQRSWTELSRQEIKQVLARLGKFYKCVTEDPHKDESYCKEVKKFIAESMGKLSDKAVYSTREEIMAGYKEEQGFLSQQIDERMHQIWTLGALFVPISFLIFAQAITLIHSLDFFFLLWAALLEIASLICYGVWYRIYLRARRFNELSYPRIHSLEVLMNKSEHLYLDYVRKEYSVTTKPAKWFKYAFSILGFLWVAYIVLTLVLAKADPILLTVSIVVQTVICTAALVAFGDPK
jgi:hypothetical protein